MKTSEIFFLTDTLAKMTQNIFAYFSISEHSASFSHSDPPPSTPQKNKLALKIFNGAIAGEQLRCQTFRGQKSFSFLAGGNLFLHNEIWIY